MKRKSRRKSRGFGDLEHQKGRRKSKRFDLSNIPVMHPKISEGVDRVMESDASYFLEHPNEDWFIRPAAEVEEVDAISKGFPRPEFMRVIRIAEGVRMRQPVASMDELISGPQNQQIQRARQALAGRIKKR